MLFMKKILKKSLLDLEYSQNVIDLLTSDNFPLMNCFNLNDKMRTSRFDDFIENGKSKFDAVIQESFSSSEPIIRNLVNNIFPTSDETMDFNSFISKLKETLNEDDHIENEEDDIRRYLYLKLAEQYPPTLDNYYSERSLYVNHEKVLRFFNLHGKYLLAWKAKKKSFKQTLGRFNC